MVDIVWLLRNDCPCNGDIGCAQELSNQAADEIERLRADADFNYMHGYESAKSDYRDQLIESEAEIERLKDGEARLRAALREAYEVYAGSDGFIPETASEGYQQQIIKQMVNCISTALKEKSDE